MWTFQSTSSKKLSFESQFSTYFHRQPFHFQKGGVWCFGFHTTRRYNSTRNWNRFLKVISLSYCNSVTFLKSHDDTEPDCWGSDVLNVKTELSCLKGISSSLRPHYVLCQILYHVMSSNLRSTCCECSSKKYLNIFILQETSACFSAPFKAAIFTRRISKTTTSKCVVPQL